MQAIDLCLAADKDTDGSELEVAPATAGPVHLQPHSSIGSQQLPPISTRSSASQLLLNKLSLQMRGECSPAAVDAMHLDPQPHIQQGPAVAGPHAASPFDHRDMQGLDGSPESSPAFAARMKRDSAAVPGQSRLASRRSSGDSSASAQLPRRAAVVCQVIENALVPQMLWKLQEDDFWIQVCAHCPADSPSAASDVHILLLESDC